MSVPINYLTVVLVWATTPLAVQWSNDSVSPIAAVAARMAVALVFSLCLALMFNQLRLGFNQHWKLYLAASIALFPNMPLVYLAAEYIPSGLISVLFGLSPFCVAVFGQYLLAESKLAIRQWIALLVALAGLVIIFIRQLAIGEHAVYGVLLMLVSVLLFSLSGVLVKRYHSGANPLQQLNGSLLFSMPGFLLSWFLLDGLVPGELSQRSLISIAYLAIIGSLVGFMAYFYLQRNLSVTSVSLIPLITPAMAVMLGVWINNEVLSMNTLFGTACIIAGLALFNLAPVLAVRKALAGLLGKFITKKWR